MKNVIFSGNTVTRLIKPSVLALLFAGIVNVSSAQTSESKLSDVPVEIKYVGSTQGSPLFQIAFNNPQGDEVSVTLRDQDGYAIYTDVTKEKTYLRTLRLDGLDFNTMKLVLNLRTKKETQTKSFEVTRNTRTVEDVAVVSL